MAGGDESAWQAGEFCRLALTTRQSPPHPAPGSKTDGPGSPSQTPVHAAPSGAIELLVPYRQRTGALRFGDQRAMALTGALCLVAHAVTGFTNKSLRGQVAGLFGKDYSSSQMS